MGIIGSFLCIIGEFPEILLCSITALRIFVTLLITMRNHVIQQGTCPKPKMQLYQVYIFDHSHASGNCFEDHQFEMLQKKVGQETHLLQQMQWQLPMSWKGLDGFRWNLELVERHRGSTKTVGQTQIDHRWGNPQTKLWFNSVLLSLKVFQKTHWSNMVFPQYFGYTSWS